MTWRVDTVFVWVNDVPRAVQWYQDFGIEPGPAHGDWQTMILDGQTRFALHSGERAPGAPTAVVAFEVADLDAEMERLAATGIEPVDEVVTDTGVSRFRTYSDPDGNHVQLLQR